MIHEDFIKEWTWKPYNYDQSYGPECVDLFKWYSRDVKWIIIKVALWAAKDYYIGCEKYWAIKTINPEKWDFAFTKYTEWWHVWIFDHFEPGWLFFWQFDQLWNWEQVWWEKPPKLRKYPIKDLYWFVSYKKNTEEEPKMPIWELRNIWNTVKIRNFNDYSIDERIKMLIDIWANSKTEQK